VDGVEGEMITILREAHVFGPEDLGRRTIVVAGGRILWIGPELPAVPEALVLEELDLGGLRIIPGMIDGHVHPTGAGGESGATTRVPAPSLSSYTSAGVTGVVGMLGTDAETRGMAELLAQVRCLREEGIGAWCFTGGYHFPPRTLTGSVRGDLVHLDSVVGVGEVAISDFRSSQPTFDEFLRIASEAQVGGMIAGKASVLHLHVGGGERGLEFPRRALEVSELPPRLFHPTHVNRRRATFEEALELAARGLPIDLSCYPVVKGEDAIPADEALARYLDAGLPPDGITISSDAGGSLPIFDESGRMIEMGVGSSASMADTLAALFRSGRAPGEFLPAFTSNWADLLKIPRKGRLAPGADADLLVLGEDNTIHSVMAGGVWHVREGVQLVRGAFEPTA
jgi:beta-aspartyl-dipeptidase (metallo-type)